MGCKFVEKPFPCYYYCYQHNCDFIHYCGKPEKKDGTFFSVRRTLCGTKSNIKSGWSWKLCLVDKISGISSSRIIYPAKNTNKNTGQLRSKLTTR